jgi:hypothetical protein
LNGIQEVAGSIPASSTNFLLCRKFGALEQ